MIRIVVKTIMLLVKDTNKHIEVNLLFDHEEPI